MPRDLMWIHLAGINLMRLSRRAVPTECVQVRHPMSKRSRIRKKWAKDRRNWSMVPVSPYAMRVGQSLYVDPDTYDAVKALERAEVRGWYERERARKVAEERWSGDGPCCAWSGPPPCDCDMTDDDRALVAAAERVS